MSYLRLAGQFAVILLLFAGVAALADWPAYRQIPPGYGVVMLTFVHAAERVTECRRLSAQEIAKLPPNMRRVQDCPRGRRPVYVSILWPRSAAPRNCASVPRRPLPGGSRSSP
jgi:hypothetical protein